MEKEETLKASMEAFDLVMGEGLKPFEEFKPQYDQAMLRWFIYGSVEEVDPCDIYERFMSRNLHKDRFPSIFVKALIFHIAECEICREIYLDNHPVPEVPTPQDA